MCFTILQKEKTPFQTKKNQKSKTSKNWDFSKEVSPWFGLKFSIFPSSYFRQNRPGKCVSRYSRKKKRVLQATKRKSPKSRNFGIFKKGLIQGFDKKNGNFFIFIVLAKQARRMCFTIFQNENTPFQTIETRS